MPPFIRNLMERFGKGRTLLIPLVGVATIVLIWGFSRWATAPEWVALLPGLPLETVAEVTAKLDEAKVPYRLERGGAEVRVPSKDLARARVLLAQAGIPTKGRPGFELFDQPSWGMTDFTQRVNYRRALEGELERTISQMRGIEAAQVHLALQETSVFRRSERPSEASVFLKLRSGARPDAELVDAITFLVASSVDGLSSENVTVLDNVGRVLTAALEPGLSHGLTKRQLALQREVESYLEQKAEGLVAEVVGAGNVQVRVSATLNFDRIDRTIQAVDPDQQVVTREERSEIIPGPGVDGAASKIENTSYEGTRRIETFSSGIGAVKRLTVSVLVNDRVVGEGDAARVEPRSEEELRRIELLVRGAVGLDPSRGDEIMVVGVPFGAQPVAVDSDDGPSVLVIAQTFQRPIVVVIAAVLAFILGLQVLRTLRRPEEAPIAELPQAEAAELAEAAADEQLRITGPGFGDGLRLEGGDRVRATMIERPENAVRVIRAWMKEA